MIEIVYPNAPVVIGTFSSEPMLVEPILQLPTEIEIVFQGPPGGGVSISSDPNNRLQAGPDGKLFVPDLTTDPVAYYILAKD